ncbi:unnamed protein product, partial [Medioppia subpectinata]
PLAMMAATTAPMTMTATTTTAPMTPTVGSAALAGGGCDTGVPMAVSGQAIVGTEHSSSDNTPKTLAIDIDAMSDANPDMSIESIVTTDEKEICRSDLIAIQYEEEIRELREDLDLLCLLTVHEIRVTHEDQINAKSHLILTSDEESAEEEAMAAEDMDVDGDEKSSAKSRNKCRICGRKFDSEPLLDAHCKLHKTFDGQQVRCAEDMCGHQFDTNHELRDHLKRVHLGRGGGGGGPATTGRPNSNTPKAFECKECPTKRFPSMQSLRLHQKSVHNMISWFKCKFSGCDEKFEKPLELKAHEAKHRKDHTVIDFRQPKKPALNSDPKSQMELLEMFFAFNKKKTET